MSNARFYWHVHHDLLFEWCYDYDERVKYITDHKPIEEQPTRLRLFQPVQNVPGGLNKAREAYHKAGEAYDPEMKALHSIECPNCPWDGVSIFPREASHVAVPQP